MAVPDLKPDYPLLIEVTRSFPLRKILNIKLKVPGASFHNDISIDREQAIFLLGALSETLNIKEEKSESEKGEQR